VGHGELWYPEWTLPMRPQHAPAHPIPLEITSAAHASPSIGGRRRCLGAMKWQQSSQCSIAAAVLACYLSTEG
jgi:hypothetical protein